MNALTHFLASIRNRNDEGQDLLEYALLIALIAIVGRRRDVGGHRGSGEFAAIAAAITAAAQGGADSAPTGASEGSCGG